MVKNPPTKTSVSSTEDGTANGLSRKSATKRSTSKQTQTATDGASSKQRTVTRDRIGETAGEVWQALADQEEQSLAALKKSIDAPGDLVLAAVGWLAREDKLRFTARGRSVKVSLRL